MQAAHAPLYCKLLLSDELDWLEDSALLVIE